MMQRHPLHWSGRALALLVLLAWLTPGLGATTPDLRLLIDVSGSMRQTDPDNLRAPALRLVNQLLPAGASAGVWLFAEKVEILAPPGKVDAAWKGKTGARLDRIHSRGLFTDIEQAIEAAIQDWGEVSADSERHLVLFTDGLVDVSKEADKSAASRTRILSQQLERLKALKIKVHAIALSDQVDMELMRLLATQTGGWLETAKTADALQRVFLRMLEQTAAPTTVPLSGNGFEIDDQVSEFTLLAFRAEGEKTQLTAPDGLSIRADQLAPGVTWRAEAGYDLVTLSKPKPGKWRLRGVQDPDNRVVVVTDLGIDASALPNTLSLGERPRVETWLTDHKQPVTRTDLLKLLTAKAIVTPEASSGEPRTATPHPVAAPAMEEGQAPPTVPAVEEGHPPPTVPAMEEGHTAPAVSDKDASGDESEIAEPAQGLDGLVMELDSGSKRFGATLDTQALGSGIHQLEFVIDGGTFKRQIIKRFKILGTPISLTQEPRLPSETDPNAAILLTLKGEPDLLDPASLSGYLLAEGPEDWREVIDIPKGNPLPFGVRIPVQTPGEYRIKGHFMARTLTQEPLEIQPETLVATLAFEAPDQSRHAESAESVEKTPISWLGLGAYLLGGNVLLGMTLGLTWWLMRRDRGDFTARTREKPVKRKRA